MDRSFSVLLLFLMLIYAVAVASTAATVLPQDYWKQMLPDNPMPLPVRDMFVRPADVAGSLSVIPTELREERRLPEPSSKVDLPAAPGQSSYRGQAVAGDVKVASPFIFIFNNQPPTQEELTNEANRDIFFLEEDLHPGARKRIHFIRRTPEAPFLPRPVADALPFSVRNLTQILEIFSVPAGSKEAENMRKTLLPCGVPEKEEAALCATSLVSMVDFAFSSLGTRRVQALSTVGSNKRQFYTVVDHPAGVETLVREGEEAIACHSQPYPYAVFYCHGGAGASKVFRVRLVGDDGGRTTALAVCHTRTAGWHPKHLGFQLLNVKPGTTICHFLQQDNVVWVPHRHHR